MKKICGIATLPNTIQSFMLGNLQYVAKHGYSSYCICGNCIKLPEEALANVKAIQIEEMKWGLMSLKAFLKCVTRLYRIFKQEHFDIIQYATSNASLCSSIAGWLAKVPVRINLQWGISYPIYKGWKRLLFYLSTKITCCLSTSVQPDSKGNLQFSIIHKLYPKEKGSVIYNGSACGLDLKKYDINKRCEWRQIVSRKYNLNNYNIVFGFVGRVVVEKGINELFNAFLSLNKSDSCLLIVGPIDHLNTLDQTILAKIEAMNNVYFVGAVNNTACYYAAMDFLILPSYQEGFGMTILEAAGLGVPSIITNIKGPTELIVDGVNGFICDVRSAESLSIAMNKAYNMPTDTYNYMSENAHMIAARDFDSDIFKQKFLENRDELLNNCIV